jgi:DNA-binding phage protein
MGAELPMRSELSRAKVSGGGTVSNRIEILRRKSPTPRNATGQPQVESMPAVDPALLAFLAEELKTQDAVRIVKALREMVKAMGWPAFVHRVGICRLVLERDFSRGSDMPRSTLTRVATGFGISLDWREGEDCQVTEATSP